VINLTDVKPLRQSAWAAAVGVKVTALPRAPIFKTAEALDLVGGLVPNLGARLPKALLPPQLTARFKHLRYGTQRSEDILGLRPGGDAVDRLFEYAELQA
jgi:hypothetical protein